MRKFLSFISDIIYEISTNTNTNKGLSKSKIEIIDIHTAIPSRVILIEKNSFEEIDGTEMAE